MVFRLFLYFLFILTHPPTMFQSVFFIVFSFMIYKINISYQPALDIRFFTAAVLKSSHFCDNKAFLGYRWFTFFYHLFVFNTRNLLLCRFIVFFVKKFSISPPIYYLPSKNIIFPSFFYILKMKTTVLYYVCNLNGKIYTNMLNFHSMIYLF